MTNYTYETRALNTMNSAVQGEPDEISLLLSVPSSMLFYLRTDYMTPDEWREGIPAATLVDDVILVYDKVLREHEKMIDDLKARVRELEKRPDSMQVYGGLNPHLRGGGV